MADRELGGNIVLVDFSLEDQEMIIVKKIVGNYARKIKNFVEYQELKIELKSHQRNKGAKKYEMKASLIFDGERLNSEVSGLNLFVVLSEIMNKLLSEVEHKIKK